MMLKGVVIGTLSAALTISAVEARPIPNTGTPQSVQQLIACRTITDSAQRLACYDRQSDALSTALRFSADGQRLWSAEWDGTLVQRDVATARERQRRTTSRVRVRRRRAERIR